MVVAAASSTFTVTSVASRPGWGNSVTLTVDTGSLTVDGDIEGQGAGVNLTANTTLVLNGDVDGGASAVNLSSGTTTTANTGIRQHIYRVDVGSGTVAQITHGDRAIRSFHYQPAV